jgi:multiple sugar transport system permease protein
MGGEHVQLTQVEQGKARARREMWTGVALVLPAVLVMMSFVLFPVLYNLWLGFFQKHAMFPGQKWVGMANYVQLLADPIFWQSTWLGLVYAGVAICFQLILGVGAALLLHTSFPGRSLVRGVTLFPYMLPVIVATSVWGWILNDLYGVANFVLIKLGLIAQPIAWINQDHIMLAMVVLSVWAFFPFMVITVLARLQTIPPELYEAAKVDGANGLQQFVHITLPQIRGVLFVSILLRGVWMFTKFDVPYILSGGGSGGGAGARTLPVYTYQRIFGTYEAGLGAASANLMFLMLVVAIIIYYKLFHKGEEA